MESLDRQGLNLSMDVGGMQLTAAGATAGSSPTSRLVDKHSKVSHLALKLRHLQDPSSETAFPSSIAQASTQDAKGQESKRTLGQDGALGLDISQDKVEVLDSTSPGRHDSEQIVILDEK